MDSRLLQNIRFLLISKTKQNKTKTLTIYVHIFSQDFLSSARYYNGDLAARNILVGEDLVVKISDFGMADDIYTQDVMELAPKKKRAVKWVSLEANLSGQCSIMGDM